jgi:uncharacterized tellurite resistance protein B-like protein
MLDSIRAYFGTRLRHPGMDEQRAAADLQAARVRLAACALLLELAYADSEFTDGERAHIEGVLERHFALPAGEVRELIALAEHERRHSIDHFQFTHLVAEHYDLGQKLVLAEAMWGVILADGTIAAHEAYLVRKLANLLDVEPGYLTAARRRVAGEA